MGETKQKIEQRFGSVTFYQTNLDPWSLYTDPLENAIEYYLDLKYQSEKLINNTSDNRDPDIGRHIHKSGQQNILKQFELNLQLRQKSAN